MAMVYDYASGPAWRQRAGLTAETWVEPDTASFGARYPQPSDGAARLAPGRQQGGYVDPRDMARADAQDLEYARQAKVLGSTANYLMFGFTKDRSDLAIAARDGDSERARLIRERMLKFRDEHMDSLLEWSVVGGDGRQGGHAEKMAETARNVLSDEYMKDSVASFTDESGRTSSMTIEAFLGSTSPEAVRRSAENARRTLNLSQDAAAIYADRDNPLYGALDGLRQTYQGARMEFGRTNSEESDIRAKKAALGLQLGAEFAASHKNDDPSQVRGFLMGWTSVGAPQASLGALDDMYNAYVADFSSSRTRDASSWFGGLSSAISSLEPVQRRASLDKDGKPMYVDEPSEFTRKDRLPGMLMQTRRVLEDRGYDVSDFGKLGASLKRQVQRADVVARWANVSDPQFVKLGDSAVAAAVYEYSGRDPLLFNASDRGKNLASSADTLDNAYATGIRLANSMGVRMDENAPVNSIDGSAPGLLNAMAKQVFQAVYRSKLRGDDADGVANEIASILHRGDAGGPGRDYNKLAALVLDKVNRNFESGLSMDFGSILREIGGGFKVRTVQTQDGAVPVSQRIIPPKARSDIDYATGLPMTSAPGDGVMLTTVASKRRAFKDPVQVAEADRSLRDMATSTLPYEDALKNAGKGELADAVKAVAAGVAEIHHKVDFSLGSDNTEALVRPVSALLLDNLQKQGLDLSPEESGFVQSGDLIRFLDRHDRAVKGELNDRARRFSDMLADRVLNGDASAAGLFSRVAVELLTRYGVKLTSSTARAIGELGFQMRDVEGYDPLGRVIYSNSDYSITMSDSRAKQYLDDLRDRLHRRYGKFDDDVLKSAGYEGVAFGLRNTSNDYTGIFRQFDLRWRRDAPTITPAPRTGNTAAAQNDVQPDYDADAAGAANHVLGTAMSGNDALDEASFDLLSNIAHNFKDPAAAQNYAQLYVPYMRSLLKTQGYQALRAWVDAQGKMRRHRVMTGTIQNQDLAVGGGLITHEQYLDILDKVYHNDEARYNADQRRLEELEGVQDQRYLAAWVSQAAKPAE